MSKLPKVDVFRCDSCGKSVVCDSHEIKLTSPYCWTSEMMTLSEENLADADMIPNSINTIQLPYINRSYIDIQDRGDMDWTVGAQKGRVADEVKIAEYHVCDECMNKMQDEFTDVMNQAQELQEKYFDSCFN